MTADVIQANYEQLEQIAKVFSDQSQQVRRTHQQLQQQVEVLRAGGMLSDAGSVFYHDMDGEVLPAVQRLFAALEQSGDSTLRIIAILAQADEEAANILKNARIDLKFDWNTLGNMVSGEFLPDLFEDLAGPLTRLMGDSTRFLSKEALDEVLRFGLGGVSSGVIDHIFRAMNGETEFGDMGDLGVQVTSGLIQEGIENLAWAGGAVILGSLGLAAGGSAVTAAAIITVPAAIIFFGDKAIQYGGLGLEAAGTVLNNEFGFDLKDEVEAIHNFREAVSLDNFLDDKVAEVGNVISEQAGQAMDSINEFFQP